MGLEYADSPRFRQDTRRRTFSHCVQEESTYISRATELYLTSSPDRFLRTLPSTIAFDHKIRICRLWHNLPNRVENAHGIVNIILDGAVFEQHCSLFFSIELAGIQQMLKEKQALIVFIVSIFRERYNQTQSASSLLYDSHPEPTSLRSLP